MDGDADLRRADRGSIERPDRREHYGGYGSGASFVDGMNPAISVGAALVGVAALAALAIPRRLQEAAVAEPEPDLALEAA